MHAKYLAPFLTVLLSLTPSNSSFADQKVKTKSNIKNDRMTTSNADSSLGRIKINIEAADSGETFSATTNEGGCATFSDLQPGEYKVMVSDFSKHLVVGREAQLALCLVPNGEGADLVKNKKLYVGHVTLMK